MNIIVKTDSCVSKNSVCWQIWLILGAELRAVVTSEEDLWDTMPGKYCLLSVDYALTSC